MRSRLLSSQYAQMDLPPREMVKLEGPATIEGDALTVSVFNGTDWHVSEVAVALTIVKKSPQAIGRCGHEHRTGRRKPSALGSRQSRARNPRFVRRRNRT